MKKLHKLKNIEFENDKLQINIDGFDYTFPLKSISLKLHEATTEERSHFKISDSGYGINWPLLDEDLSIDGMLKQIKSVKLVRKKKKSI
ncbi:MAG: DUF2442 domain-containing protein [bacterium]